MTIAKIALLLGIVAATAAPAMGQPAPQFPTGDQYLQSRSSQAEAAAVQALNEVARLQGLLKEREARIREIEAARAKAEDPPAPAK
jgi:hypothetical protein